MRNEIFIDTSGFYALLVRSDDQHPNATHILKASSERKLQYVTTDYVLDETATLLKARGCVSVLGPFFDTVFASSICRILWTDVERFHCAKALFLKCRDQDWSFTDCLSFCVMKELKLKDALTKDTHFKAAGYAALLI